MKAYIKLFEKELSKESTNNQNEKFICSEMFSFYLSITEIVINRYYLQNGKVGVSEIKERLKGELAECLIVNRSSVYIPTKKIGLDIKMSVRNCPIAFGSDLPTYPVNNYIDTLTELLARLNNEKGITIQGINDLIKVGKKEKPEEIQYIKEYDNKGNYYETFNKKEGEINLNFYPLNIIYSLVR